MFAEVLYFAELPSKAGTDVATAIVKPYGKLISELHHESEMALEACYARTSEELTVIPLECITSVIAIIDFPNGPPGSVFVGEKLGFMAEILFGVPDEAAEDE
jgi:hypothetical protein